MDSGTKVLIGIIIFLVGAIVIAGSSMGDKMDCYDLHGNKILGAHCVKPGSSDEMKPLEIVGCSLMLLGFILFALGILEESI